MTDQSWKGEHLIRARTPSISAELVDLAAVSDDRATKIVALRAAAVEGKGRFVAAEELGLTYAQVVWMAKRHGIRFADPRRLRRREGGV